MVGESAVERPERGQVELAVVYDALKRELFVAARGRTGAASFSTSFPARFSIATPEARDKLSASIRRSTRRLVDPESLLTG